MLNLKLVSAYLFIVGINLIVCEKITNNKSDVRVSELLDKFFQNDYHLDFEHADVIRTNKRYMNKFEIITFKYNRSLAVLNVTWSFNVDVGYDYSTVIQAYKFASNEYRLFPMRICSNVCDAVNKNIVGIQSYIHCGNFTGCPILKNKSVTICNWFPDSRHLPPYIPNGRYMLEIQGLFNNTELYMFQAYSTIWRPVVKK